MAIPLIGVALGTVGRGAAIAGRGIGSALSRGGRAGTRLVRTTNNLNRRFRTIDAFAKTLPPKAHKFFRRTTPIDTGNARRKTSLDGNTIRADYPYANRLNEGYSRQAKRGMTQPTIAYIRRELRKLR